MAEVNRNLKLERIENRLYTFRDHHRKMYAWKCHANEAPDLIPGLWYQVRAKKSGEFQYDGKTWVRFVHPGFRLIDKDERTH